MVDALREPLVETPLGMYRMVCETCWRGSRNFGFIEETPKSREILRVRIKNFRPEEYGGDDKDSCLPDYKIIEGTNVEQEKTNPRKAEDTNITELENNATPQEMTNKGQILEENELEMAKMATGTKRKAPAGGMNKHDATGIHTRAKKKLFESLEKELD